LAECFPEAGVWPQDPATRAQARCICAEMHSGFSPLRAQMPMNLRARLPGKGRSPEVLADIARITDIWEGCRLRFGDGGPFLFGRFCAADAFYAPVVTRFVTYAVELPAASAAYSGAMLNLPAMLEWTAAGVGETRRLPMAEIYA
jgi:glutathione S-transferase